MLVPPKLASLFVALAVSASLLLSGCSSSSPRDINYGTDVAVGWVPPDVAPTITVTDSAAVDSQIASDSANAVDGGVLQDASQAPSIDTVAVDSQIASDSANAVGDGVLEDASENASIDASVDGDS
jgi:PBP1b-binding outer membrane lipoprotein LpoB